MGVRIHSSQKDTLTDKAVTIDYTHHEIHEGDYFSWGDKQTLTTGSYIEYGFQTGAKYVHVKPTSTVSSADQLSAVFYKDCSYTGGTALENAVNRNHNSDNLSQVTVVSSPTVNLTIAALQAGAAFANQPAGDQLTVVSSSAEDVGQIVTVYGTITGATDTVTIEQITLNGATAVNSVATTFQNILGIEVNAAHAGTITLAEKSGGLAITTLAAGTNSKGIATLTLTSAFGSIPRHDCSGASTAPVGIVGYTENGALISSVDTLNGTTEEDHGTTKFWAISKVLIGAVAADRNVLILSQRPGAKFSSFYIPGATGVGGVRTGSSVSGDEEFVLLPNAKYVIRFDNGSSGNNTFAWSMQWYEELEGIGEE